MATAVAHVRADDVEAALIQLDADYCTVYGPNLGDWPRGVRGEFFERQRSRRTVDREWNPVHPRRASAARRRRHFKQLAYRVHRIAPGAVTVLLAPVWTDATGEAHRVFIAQCMDGDGRRLKLPAGGSRNLADLMQGVFPAVDWNQAQTWRADSNRLTTWSERRAAS